VSDIALPACVRIADEHGLARLDIRTPVATAQVFLQGAQVTEWTPSHAAESVLWLSPRSVFAPGKAIRGGVPICLPWFGAHPTDPAAPAHGFARLVEWSLVEAIDTDGIVTLVFRLQQATPGPDWPHPFRATYRIAIGSTLMLALDVENIGTAAFTFQEALHSYFAVTDVERITITGLEGSDYLDKVDDFARKSQRNDPITFNGETDRVYLDTAATCRIADPSNRRVITVEKSGSMSTVVWNPGRERGMALTDVGDPGWRGMVCVETANVRDSAVRLEAGATHTMITTLRLTSI